MLNTRLINKKLVDTPHISIHLEIKQRSCRFARKFIRVWNLLNWGAAEKSMANKKINLGKSIEIALVRPEGNTLFVLVLPSFNILHV